MATFDINAVARRAQYTSTGQSAFTFNFQVNATSELKVYVDDVVKTETTHYSASLNADGTGTVTFNSATTADEIITIIGDQPLSRTTVFQVGLANNPTTLETEFDNLLIRQQQLKEMMDRSIQLKPTTGRTVTGAEFSTTGPLYFPEPSASKVLSFNSAGTGLEATNSLTDISTLAGKADEIGRLGTADAVADMNTLGTADIVTDMNLLATSANVTAMGLLGTSANITAMGLLGTSDAIADMNTLATAPIVADLAMLATTDIVADLAQLATSDFVSDLNAIEAVKANVTTVADNLAGVNSFAERYRVGSTNPVSSLDEGDLFYNDSDNTLKYYNGSGWASITAGIGSMADDTTPQLGGDLDLNGNNIDFPTTANISDCLDEDAMGSDSATALATQQSIKAYVDGKKSELYGFKKTNGTGSQLEDLILTYTNGLDDISVANNDGTQSDLFDESIIANQGLAFAVDVNGNLNMTV
tara:strand:- start:165 stop:1583 length:1419 start_codon:yes stop_codon:yes gene_type:complete